MPPKKAKTTTPKASAAAAAKSAVFNEAVVEALFDKLADEDDPDLMSMEGIGTLCEEMGIDPSSDVRCLVMVWKLGSAAKPGAVTKVEFVAGMRKLGKTDAKGLATCLPMFDPGFLEQQEFRDFYKFVFLFSREGTHKTIEKDLVADLMPIVLSSGRAPHLEQFLLFLRSDACKDKRITMDQWDSFLVFNQAVNLDLSNHEDDGACKTLCYTTISPTLVFSSLVFSLFSSYLLPSLLFPLLISYINLLSLFSSPLRAAAFGRLRRFPQD
jgi:hypothetical protein